MLNQKWRFMLTELNLGIQVESQRGHLGLQKVKLTFMSTRGPPPGQGRGQDGQVRSGYVRLGQVRSCWVRLGQVRLGLVGFGWARPIQFRSGQVRSGQFRLILSTKTSFFNYVNFDLNTLLKFSTYQTLHKITTLGNNLLSQELMYNP